ncbi:MAG TPA: hypothetical protein VMZ91_03990 [Candidatus Paceibacterota bacterium]|nr:hypothetical protein [Candidatus Paceibacterota bacterium]
MVKCLGKYHVMSNMLEDLKDATIIDIYHNKNEETCSCAKEEVVFNFSNGKEILIYLNDDGIIKIEID